MLGTQCGDIKVKLKKVETASMLLGFLPTKDKGILHENLR